MSNISQKKETVNSMSQAPNLGRLLCRSKFELQLQQQQQQQQQQVQNHEARIVELWEKLRQLPVSFISILFIYLGKSIKSFLLKNSFNGESTIFICAVIFQGSKRNNINN